MGRHTSHGLPTTQTTLWPFVQLSVGSDDMSFKALPVLVVLAIFLVRGCLSCGAKPIVTGNSFCATQQCTHIYNFRPCSYWNPAQCTCSGSTATCPSGYTADSDGTKCYILRSGQSSWADASAQCRSNGDDRLAVITSANQNTAVQGLIGSTNAYIGLSDTAAEATFLDGREHNEQLLKLDQWPAHHPRQPGLCRDAFQLRFFRPVGSCWLQQDRHQLRLRAQTNLLVGTIERKLIIDLMQAKK